jgi:hypothetical protein
LVATIRRRMIYHVVVRMETVWKHQLAAVAFPESFARRLGQVVEIDPVPATISSKALPADLSSVILFIEDVVGVEDIRPPECRFGGGRINRQSDLPTPRDFRLVFVNVGQSVVVDRFQSFAGFRHLPSGLVDGVAVSDGSHFLVVAQDGIDKIRDGVVMILVDKFIVVFGWHWHLLHLFCGGEVS